MASDNIFQQYLQPAKSVQEYAAEYDQADARKQTYQQNALELAVGRQKFGETQQASQRNALVRAAQMNLPPDATNEQRAQAMRATGYPEGLAAAEALDTATVNRRKGLAAADKDDAEAAKTNLARDIALHDYHAQKLATVQTPEDAMAWAQEGKGLGVFSQPGQYERGVAAIQQAATNPQSFAQWKERAMQGGQSITAQMTQKMEAIKQAEQVRQFGVTDQRIQSEGAANRGVQIRGQNMTDARAKEANNGDDLGFTPEAITNAAARYNKDGTLPPMGMGKSGAAGRKAILNQAAVMASGIDPSQQRENQLAFKGDMATQNAAVRAYATGKDGQAIQSANTALNHLQTIRTLAEAQKTGDVRVFNQAARALGAQFGQAAPTNLNAALIMVGPEVSKAVVGVNGTGHEREQAIQALNPNGSLDQIIGGTQTMEELFGGRLTEARRTYERTTKRKDFDDALLSPAARDVISRQHGATPGTKPGAAAVPSDIADLLKKHGGK